MEKEKEFEKKEENTDSTPFERMICFLPEKKLAGNFCVQLVQILRYKYQEKNSFIIEEKNRKFIFVADYETVKGSSLREKLYEKALQYRRNCFLRREEQSTGGKLFAHVMKHEQDYPQVLYGYFAQAFLQKQYYGKRTRFVMIAGECLSPGTLGSLIMEMLGKVNYLSVFLGEDADEELYREALAELFDYAEEEYGLLLELTRQKSVLQAADVILDGSRFPVRIRGKNGKTLSYLLMDDNRKKQKSLKHIKAGIALESWGKCLDRAFHNKV